MGGEGGMIDGDVVRGLKWGNRVRMGVEIGTQCVKLGGGLGM